MIAVEIPVEIGLPPPKTPRSEGIHVSNIIRAIAVENGLLKPEWTEEIGEAELTDAREITDPVALLRINIGLAWESHYIPMLMDVEDHPGEMEIDGIFMTHDGESVSVVMSGGRQTHKVVVHEVKATFYSTRTVGDLSDRWMWLTQMKAYCKGLGTRYAVMHTLFLCGDYTYPIKPMLKKWLIEFTQEEVDQNWKMLTAYRDQRIKRGTASIVP